MSDRTTIEWADATWNPVIGCSPVSAGCDHCYAARLASRFHPRLWGTITTTGGRWSGDVVIPGAREKVLSIPERWRRPRRVFVCSMGDLFHPDVADAWRSEVWAAMERCRRHTFVVLTKRPHVMRLWGAKNIPLPPLPNVWLGASVESQAAADARIPHLLATPAALRLVSLEPLLGPVDLSRWLHCCPSCGRPRKDRIGDSCMACEEGGFGGLDWVIVGGETGPGARPMQPDWVRSVRDQCQASGVPFLFKSWGDWMPAVDFLRPGQTTIGHRVRDGMVRCGKKRAGRLLDGREWNEFPGVV